MQLTVLSESTPARSLPVHLSVFDQDFQPLAGVRVLSLEHRLGPRPGRAVLELVLDSFHRRVVDGWAALSPHRMEFLQDPECPLRLDQPVWVGLELDQRRALLLFAGRVTDRAVSFSGSASPPAEAVCLEALDARWTLSTVQVLGQYFWDAASGRVHAQVPALLNPDGEGNRDPQHFAQTGGLTPLFADPGAGSRWTAADALQYVLGHYAAGRGLELPGELLAMSALDLPLPELSLEGKSLTEALWEVLSAADLEAWVDPVLVLERSGRELAQAAPVLRLVDRASAPLRAARLAAAGAVFSTGTAELQEGALTFSTRPVRNQWRLQGALTEYEACFQLTPLWSEEEESGAAESDRTRRGHGDYDPALDHVYRCWGLNEDGRWSDRATYDFSWLFWPAVPRRRPFLPPFAPPGESRPIVVEVKAQGLPDVWHRVGSGAIRLLPERAGIYLECEDTDGVRSGLRVGDDRSVVALDRFTAVRLTAVVRSDERPAVTTPRMDGSLTELVLERTVTDESCRRCVRDAGSLYAADGTGAILDDAAEDGPLQRRAEALRQRHQGLGVSARLVIPWIDLTWRPGTRVPGIAGRDVDFGTVGGETPDYPLVTDVVWDLARQTTAVTLDGPPAGAGMEELT